MNRQPYSTPPQNWPPRMTPWWVRLSRSYRRRKLFQGQNIQSIDAPNIHVLRDVIDAGNGVLVTPNHSAHYDAPALYVAADDIQLPMYFMTAWQVFAMSTRFECWAMQRMGCFSVNREATDRQALKQSIHILQKQPFPLVIFPEGDIYHTSDRVTTFWEGASALALSAAKRSDRPIVAVPCGIKFWYVDRPYDELSESLRRIEQRLFLRPDDSQPLANRIHRLAEGALALKELDYLGHTQSGRLRDRIRALSATVLSGLEQRHGLSIPADAASVPQRVKSLRERTIRALEGLDGDRLTAEEQYDCQCQMEDLFFLMQLYSYQGDYLADNPSFERLAETIDKFEEDILGFDYPTVRGKRRVTILFGEPVRVERERRRGGAAELSSQLESSVQGLIDRMNTPSSSV